MNGTLPRPDCRAKLPPKVVTTIAVVLLFIHFVLAVGSKLHESTTSDELVHLTAGVSYWQNHDYRLHPENGILPQRWAALPAVITGAKFPQLSQNESWRMSDVWKIGYQFFYQTGQDHFPRLMAGRAMIALFSVATGWLVFHWSRNFFGETGALFSLALYSFSPTMLAHGALVTSDMCMAFFFLAATSAWWWHLHDARPRIWWLSALTLGLAFVAKYSAILLPPMMVLMAAVRAGATEPLQLGGKTFVTRAGKFGAAAVSAVGHALIVALVIWACYGFRYTAFNPSLPPADHFIRPWSYFLQSSDVSDRLIKALTDLHALPEGFLYGLTYVLKTVSARGAFLNGEYSVAGWPSFFPWAFLLKTTVPVLLVCAIVPVVATQRWVGHTSEWRKDLYYATPLLVLFVLYWLTSLTSHLNIGHRHLLPIYPVLFIAAGALSMWMPSRQWLRFTGIAAILFWHISATLTIAPHFLAYFNILAGGPANGWHHLVDSSLDWGQDLPGLKTWLERNRGEQPVFLAYFGTGEPDYYGITATRMPFLNNFDLPNPWYEPSAGWYCISATMLQQVYSPFRGEWRSEWEKEYQELRAKEPFFREYWRNKTVQNEMRHIGQADAFVATWGRYDQLRFARLCHYLRVRGPDANVGYSILIFHLDSAEIAGATTGKLSDWSALLEKASTTKS